MSPCNKTVIIDIKEVTRNISKNGNSFKTVNAVSFQFNKGLIYNIVGPSGAGKSSLLRLLNRLDEPTDGKLTFYQKPYSSYKPTELRKKISLLFQKPFLFDGTVLDNLEYCCTPEKTGDIESLLNRVGLQSDFCKADVNDLSEGEKQRVALARSLILEPDVLLLDEPTSALDPASSRKIEELIISLARDLCLTIIIVTHNPQQALRLGGETLLLVKGSLIESGNTQDVLTNPQSDQGKKYINRELV